MSLLKNHHYSNPYQNEIWEAQKEKDKIDNDIAFAISKIVALFLALGVIFLLFSKQ